MDSQALPPDGGGRTFALSRFCFRSGAQKQYSTMLDTDMFAVLDHVETGRQTSLTGRLRVIRGFQHLVCLRSYHPRAFLPALCH